MLTDEQIDEFRLPEKLRPGDPEGRKLGLLLAQARAYNALRERVLRLADKWDRSGRRVVRDSKSPHYPADYKRALEADGEASIVCARELREAAEVK